LNGPYEPVESDTIKLIFPVCGSLNHSGAQVFTGAITEEEDEMVACSVQVFKSVLYYIDVFLVSVRRAEGMIRTAIAKFVPDQFVVYAI
jgi:hypothetical protein